MDVDTVSKVILEHATEVKTIYDMHIWTINPGRIALTAHIKLKNEQTMVEEQMAIIKRINDLLRTEYGISGTTIQIAPLEECEDCNLTCIELTGGKGNS